MESARTTPRLLIALHDVTPAHADRLERAERLLASLGVPAVTYLFVPDFHARSPAHACADFIAWCRAPRSFDVRWFLHGYFHQEGVDASRQLRAATLTEWVGQTFLTAGEGEFLLLRGGLLEERLRAGVQSFTDCFGQAPAGFVAPAWLYNEELIPALERLQFAYTESHFHVFDLRRGRALRAPVTTWASRTFVHRAGSIAAASIERRLWADRPFVRVALHPADFDHPRIVDSIARQLDALRRHRQVVTYEEACADVDCT